MEHQTPPVYLECADVFQIIAVLNRMPGDLGAAAGPHEVVQEVGEREGADFEAARVRFEHGHAASLHVGVNAYHRLHLGYRLSHRQPPSFVRSR